MGKKFLIGILSLFVVGSLAGCSKNVEVVLPNGETSKVEVEGDTPVIDPFENYEMKFSGYEGYGKAEFSVKDGADKNDMLVFKVEEYSELSNGDTVKVTVDYSSKYYSALEREDDDLEEFVFAPAYKEYVVSDLEALTEIDPFEGLKLEFDGISPYANVSFNTADCDDVVNEYFDFGVETDDEEALGLTKGENVTIKAICSLEEDELGAKGYTFTKKTAEYIVECDSEFINLKSEVDFTELNANMYDIAEAKANSWVGKYTIIGIIANGITLNDIDDDVHSSAEVKSIESVELCGSYLMSIKTPKPSVTDKAYNKYYNVYCVTFSIDNGKYGGGIIPNYKMYVYCRIDNISTDEAGEMKYNEGKEFDTDMVNFWGYTTLDSLQSKQIIANKGDYNVLEIKE